MRKFINWLFGYKYIVNLTSLEVHKISNLKGNCHEHIMVNKKYVRSADDYLKNGFNGCRWCFREADSDA